MLMLGAAALELPAQLPRDGESLLPAGRGNIRFSTRIGSGAPAERAIRAPDARLTARRRIVCRFEWRLARHHRAGARTCPSTNHRVIRPLGASSRTGDGG